MSEENNQRIKQHAKKVLFAIMDTLDAAGSLSGAVNIYLKVYEKSPEASNTIVGMTALSVAVINAFSQFYLRHPDKLKKYKNALQVWENLRTIAKNKTFIMQFILFNVSEIVKSTTDKKGDVYIMDEIFAVIAIISFFTALLTVNNVRIDIKKYTSQLVNFISNCVSRRRNYEEIPDAASDSQIDDRSKFGQIVDGGSEGIGYGAFFRAIVATIQLLIEKGTDAEITTSWIYGRPERFLLAVTGFVGGFFVGWKNAPRKSEIIPFQEMDMSSKRLLKEFFTLFILMTGLGLAIRNSPFPYWACYTGVFLALPLVIIALSFADTLFDKKTPYQPIAQQLEQPNQDDIVASFNELSP